MAGSSPLPESYGRPAALPGSERGSRRPAGTQLLHGAARCSHHLVMAAFSARNGGPGLLPSPWTRRPAHRRAVRMIFPDRGDSARLYLIKRHFGNDYFQKRFNTDSRPRAREFRRSSPAGAAVLAFGTGQFCMIVIPGSRTISTCFLPYPWQLPYQVSPLRSPASPISMFSSTDHPNLSRPESTPAEPAHSREAPR